MSEILFKKGSFKILSDDVGKLNAQEMNNLIMAAGTTCYQTGETSNKTPEEFVKMLQKRRHFAMLEHSWFTFFVNSNFLAKLQSFNYRQKNCYRLWKANNLFCITEKQKGLIVSGNSRMFNEAYLVSQLEGIPSILLRGILTELNKENPILFPIRMKNSIIEKTLGKVYSYLVKNPVLLTKWELLAHRAMTVEFNNVSRGFTHENVRSRNGNKRIASYAQESTRYVDYSKNKSDSKNLEMKFIANYTGPKNFNAPLGVSVKGKIYHWTPKQMADVEEGIYKALRQNGWKPEEARQWLPIGVKSQIVQTYNLNEWRHWFFIRAGKRAHPEIRFVAVNLLKEAQKRIPIAFNGFEFGFKKDGTEYAQYVGNDKLV